MIKLSENNINRQYTKQTFRFNDGTSPRLIVVGQTSKLYSNGISIQITKTLNPDDITLTSDGGFIPYQFVYEEINSEDVVTYARYMGVENIIKNYPWAMRVVKDISFND